ncbi:hypothetical protein [uncultured Mediterranean phage]|nr:hypothetical protein [uncultured Mediterranean phage]
MVDMPMTGLPQLDQQILNILARQGVGYSSFTPAEQKSISDRLRAKHDKGEKVDEQAVANAISECAPSKVRSKAAEFTYAWSTNSDGTKNIFDVPVFSKHVRNLGVRPVLKDGEVTLAEKVIKVDEKWLNNAFERNNKRFREDNYRAPLHVRHHPKTGEQPDQTEPAGEFVLKPVRNMSYQGETLPTLFADFMRVPCHIFDQMKAGKLSYRSIEALKPDVPEVDSIALLATETPWFRYPNLDDQALGEEIQRQIYKAEGESLLHGYAEIAGYGLSALCYYAGGLWQEDPERQPEKKDPAAKQDETNANRGEAEKDKFDDRDIFQEEEKDRTLTGEEEDEDESDLLTEEGNEGDSTMGEILKALQGIAQGQNQLIEMLGKNAAPSKTDEGVPVTDPGAQRAPIQGKADEGDDAAKGELAAATAWIADKKNQESVTKLVSDTISSLSRYNLGDGAKDTLYAQAKESKDPKAVCASFVAWHEKYNTKMPLSVEEEMIQAKAADKEIELPAGLKEWGHDAKLLEKAQGFWNMYNEGVEAGMLSRTMKQADFVRHNMTSKFDSVALNGKGE